MDVLKRMLVGVTVALGLMAPIAISDAGAQETPAVALDAPAVVQELPEVNHPEWISGCTAAKMSTNSYGYWARCTSGNARYFSRAWCQLPGSGRWDYGSYVWPGTRSDGYCNTNEIASNVGWTQ